MKKTKISAAVTIILLLISIFYLRPEYFRSPTRRRSPDGNYEIRFFKNITVGPSFPGQGGASDIGGIFKIYDLHSKRCFYRRVVENYHYPAVRWMESSVVLTAQLWRDSVSYPKLYTVCEDSKETYRQHLLDRAVESGDTLKIDSLLKAGAELRLNSYWDNHLMVYSEKGFAVKDFILRRPGVLHAIHRDPHAFILHLTQMHPRMIGKFIESGIDPNAAANGHKISYYLITNESVQNLNRYGNETTPFARLDTLLALGGKIDQETARHRYRSLTDENREIFISVCRKHNIDLTGVIED